jgi:YbgC/YbaW family acyl-CoA thioester hydrolase
VQIRWADEDGYGHVNNAVYLNYLEEARDRLIDELFLDAAFDLVIVHVGIDYRSEITAQDREVLVECRLVGYGTSSVRTTEVIRKLDGTVAAEAETVLVPRAADKTGSRPLTADERGRLDQWLESNR